MKKQPLFFCLIVILILMTMPVVQAQDDSLTDDELELVNYVSDSLNKLTALTSIYLEGTQVIEQDIRAQGQTILQTITQDMTGWVLLEDLVANAMDMTTLEGIAASYDPGQDVDLGFSMDMRLLDGVLYMRVYDVPVELAGLYPDGWINFTEDGNLYQGFQLLNPEQLTNVAASTGMTNVYNENTVTGIEELESETLDDGTEVRVFSITLDAVAVFEDDSTESMLSALNLDSLGVDTETLMNDMLANAEYFVTIRIDSETDLAAEIAILLNIDTELTLQGITLDFIQNMTADFSYSRFNEEFEISAPDLEG